MSIAIGPNRQIRERLLDETARIQPRHNEIWPAVLRDTRSDVTYVPMPELIGHLDAGENLVDYLEVFVEPFSRERTL